ncbi:Rossmann-fold NAD(P)-binding domain-containing protein [Thermocatellispora tengchongensis]
MAMSRTLAEVAAGEGDVTVNVAYPGHAYTSMNRALRMSAFPVLLRPIVPVLRLIMPYVYGDLEKPARNGIRLASDPALDGVTGAYFDIKGENAAWPPTTGDPRVRAAVWELCERLAPVSG